MKHRLEISLGAHRPASQAFTAANQRSYLTVDARAPEVVLSFHMCAMAHMYLHLTTRRHAHRDLKIKCN